MQLTKLANLSKENIIFYEPKEFKVEDSKFKYQRINPCLPMGKKLQEYGSDLASCLSSPLYYKQVENTDKKRKKKQKVSLCKTYLWKIW